MIALTSLNFKTLAKSLSIDDAFLSETGFVLEEQDQLIQLRPLDKKQGGALRCDFSSGDYVQYASTLSVKSPLPKACGVKSGFRPSILDITAGLAKDSFALASIGCKVSLVEKNPVVYLLLHSGLSAYQTNHSLTLLPCQHALDVLKSSTDNVVDTVYMDPMFPKTTKSAKVKKGMQYFHLIVGEDDNPEASLMHEARRVAKNRVVVKRPKSAPNYAALPPDFSYEQKAMRFDVYINPNP